MTREILSNWPHAEWGLDVEEEKNHAAEAEAGPHQGHEGSADGFGFDDV